MSSFAFQFPLRFGMTDCAEVLYDGLAPFFREDEKYNFAGLNICKGFGKMLDPVWEIWNPVGQKKPGALLFDPVEAKIKWVEWMAQFVGTELSSTASESVKREWVKNPQGWQRGTNSAIKAAVEASLTGKKTVFFYPRYGGAAFVLKVATIDTETPNEKETIIAAESLLPAWIKLEYSRVSGGTYGILEAAHALYSESEAAHATYEHAELNAGA